MPRNDPRQADEAWRGSCRLSCGALDGQEGEEDGAGGTVDDHEIPQACAHVIPQVVGPW
jgi:hypothetical protein